MPETHDVEVYKTYLDQIKATDEISFKLLGLVPLFSGTGIFLLLTQTTMKIDDTVIPIPQAVFWITGLFAALITFFIYRWELRNIQFCRTLREQAKRFEEKFYENRVLGVYQNLGDAPCGIGKGIAEGWIYSLTMLAWLSMPVVKMFL